MNQSNREQSITQLQGYLKGATITVHEIQELLLSQEHIIWMQQKEIDDLRKRLKELENLDLQNEQILYVQNINTQLKTQIEFLKSQIQEKDQLIVQFTLKPIQTPSSEIVAAQQQLIQQNLALQNIIGDLQNQILNKDTVIGQLKTQESTLDQIIGQLSNTIQNKRTQVGSAEKQKDIQNALNELQTYPDALQEIVERIIQEYKRLQFLMEEKDIEINNLRSRLQLQQQKANDSIQDILNRNQPSSSSLNRANDLVQQQATMEDLITDLERKLISQEKRRKELQNQLFQIGQENFQLDQTKKDQNLDSVQQFSINEQIIPQQSEITFQQQTQDQVFELKSANYEQQIDNLVNENQQMDDLIVDLQKKLVEKQEQFESIQNDIDKIESNPIKKKYDELILQIQTIQSQLQEKELELDQLRNKFTQTNDEEKQLRSQIEKQSETLPILTDQLQGIKKVENLNKIIQASQNDLLEKQRQLNALEEELKQKTENLEQLQQFTQEAQQLFDQEKTKLVEKEQKSQKADDLIQQILELDDLISKLELKQAEKDDQVNSLQQNLSELQQKQEFLESEISKKNQQNEQIESELKGLQQQQQRINLEIQQTNEYLTNMSEQLISLQKQKQEQSEQNKKLEEINYQLNKENTNLEVLKEQLEQTVQQLQILDMNIKENNNTIQSLQNEIQIQDQKLEQLNKQKNDLNSQLENLLTEKKNQETKLDQLEQDLNKINSQIENLHNQNEIKEKRLIDLIKQIDSIVLQDKEQLLNEKQRSEQEQNLIQEEIDRLKQRFEKIKQQQQNIEQLIENQTNLNQDMESDLIKQKFTGKELELELHSIQAQQQEMKFQIKEKSDDLDRLNEQFTKIDEEGKMMEAVLQLKQKELKGIQQKKENFAKELDQITSEIFDLKKEINLRRKYQQQQNKVDLGQQNEDVEDEIEGKLLNLNSKNNNLKDDLQKLVELSPEPEEKQKQVDLSINDDKIQKALKDREKRIEILELTIQTLQNQHSMMPVGLSKITQQQTSFLMEEDPFLQELQEKFTKESELLLDLQNKLRKTAERHYELSVKLQEWAEKESRLANELETRTQCVEKIESEIQQVFTKQSDLEFEKSRILQRIYQQENENQELLELEATTKNRLKEKKDYIQVLYKNLVEMDQKLLQLRNRMALYSQEGRQLAELVENQENERDNQKYNLQAIQEELEQIEIEIKEKQQLINSIKKEIQFDNEEKEKLEIQFINIHSKNAQLKVQIGLEETLYQKLLIDLEVQKKKDQVKFLNLFQECSTQTEYELDQFEMLSNEMQFYKITRDEITLLKQTCQQKIISIAQSDGQLQIAYNKEQLKTIVHLQQLLIQCQENENNILIETNQRRSSQLGFKSIDESNISQQFTLEQIDILFNKTFVVEVQLTEHCILIGEYKLARQWILDKQFDFQNNLYPLGVLNLIFKISIYQVMPVTLTGSKVLQLYQQIL